MTDATNTKEQEEFWSTRYSEARTGWDLGSPSTPLKAYIDQLEDKDLRILIPGAGNAYEAEYLWQQGFKNTHVLDISEAPLKAFSQRVPDFPQEQLVQANFFEHKGAYDLILEQTFFCSFPPLKENRVNYAKHMASLLTEGGKLAGLWFNIPLAGDLVKRPFGGDKAEYLTYLSPYFDIVTFEECHNSIKPRLGSELFGIFQKSV